MSEVIISLGSNQQQSAHIQWAAQRLALLLSDLRVSRRLWTRDVNSATGKWYMNLLAAGTTSLPLDELERTLKDWERETGRSPRTVTIDLDIMQYDSQRLHLKDWPRPYIQELLTDLQ